MQYQKMHTRHLKAVVEIEKDLYDDPWTLKQIRDMLPNEEARLISVVHEQEVVGYMVLYNGSDGWVIENLSVARAYQRKGIGTELLSMVPKLVNGKIRVYAADKYLGMHMLLKKMGYTAISVEHDIDGEDYYQFVSHASDVPLQA